ncbi:uncharacterized protein IL334_004511 [Kwoniella shivajii]|uniref:Transcription factor domain-containing protein n=1 Tax=Kwoniella shivajii TaxID=564305 RepID=A0ABZ1D0I1_9TREE|nr:hypothetical protein IL334_004511 [Kwoniella shivajii]
MAVDLDLSIPRPGYDERRNRNRQRIWLALFNYCGQTAKPSMMPEDSLIRSSESFILSPICIAVDFRLASNVALRRVLAASIEAIDKDNEFGPSNYKLDLRSVYQTFEKDSDAWVQVQTQRDPHIAIHANLTALHAKVIISHRWVQRSFRNPSSAGDHVIEQNQDRERKDALATCINGSLGILSTMCLLEDDLLRYTCDSKHLYFAYASFFLYKVIDTQIATRMIDPQSLSHLFDTFHRSADKLERLALSPSHTIAFHGAFLRRLSEKGGRQSSASQDDRLGGDTELLPDVTAGLKDNAALPVLYGHLSPNLPVDPLAVSSRVADPFVDETLGADIDWNDWWPFDDSTWDFGNTASTINDADWQGAVHSL